MRCRRQSDSWADSAAEQRFPVVDGRYEGDLHEGLWILSVQGYPALDEAGTPEDCAAPAEVLRLLPPASITEIDFDFRPLGSARLQGRILDERGKPIAGLRGGVGEVGPRFDSTSHATLRRTWPAGGDGWHFETDADGGFECANLTPGRYLLFVEPEGFDPRAGPSERAQLGERPPTRELELTGESTTIELTIRRAHPVRIAGRVLVDDRWATEHAQRGALPTLELVFGRGVDGAAERRDSLSCVDCERSFEAWLDASVPNPRLELELAGEKLAVPLALAPGVELAPLSIRFPR